MLALSPATQPEASEALSEVYRLEPEGMQFSRPALLTLPLGAADAQLGVLARSRDGQQLELLSVVRLGATEVTVELRQFADVFAAPAARVRQLSAQLRCNGAPCQP